MTGRNSDLERAFLDAVERVAPIPAGQGFAALVTARLNDGDRTFGGSFQRRPAPDLLVEAAEESIDLVAWSALALTVAEKQKLDARTLERLRADLQAAAVASATAFAHLNRAIGLTAEAGPVA